MLKELNSIARGLLGLHGYPTSIPGRAAATPSDVPSARRLRRPRRQDEARAPAGAKPCGVGCVSLQA